MFDCKSLFFMIIAITLEDTVRSDRGILIAIANATREVFCLNYYSSARPLPQSQMDASIYPFLDLTPWAGCDNVNRSTSRNEIRGKVVAVDSAQCAPYQKAKTIEKYGGNGVLMVASKGSSPLKNESEDYLVNITLAVISETTLAHIKALGSDVKVLQYAPIEKSRMDCSLIVIWFMAMLSISFGACWSRKVRYCLSKRYTTNKVNYVGNEASPKHESTVRDEGALNVSPKLVVLFVICMCVMLLVLYFFYDYLVFFIIAMFCLAATLGLYQCLEPFVLLLPFGTCRLPRCTLKYCVIGLQVRHLVLFLSCTTLTIAWFVLRRESYAWILQDILGIAFTINMLNVIRLPSFKICTILLVLLFFYDIFFVFVTPLLTMSGKSVMVEVATGGTSQEQMPMVLKVPHLNVDFVAACFPQYSLLGFGDILVPGLLVSYCYSFDVETNTRKVYFISVLAAYGIGLLITYAALYAMSQAQPALLYLVPCTLLPVTVISLCRKEFRHFWNGESEIVVERDDSPTTSSNPTEEISWDKPDSLGDDTHKPLDHDVISPETANEAGEDNSLIS